MFAKEIIDHCLQIDAVAVGEADAVFPDLLRWCFGEIGAEALEGLCLRIDGKTVMKDRLSGYIQDLDALPRPGYEFYNLKEYEADTAGWWDPDGIGIKPLCMPILTSRACPNRCNFCSAHLMMGSPFRERSAENVFEEIKFLYDVYGANYFRIMDDNFTLNRDRAVRICKMIIESGMKVYFDTRGGLSIRTLDEELIFLMRRAGFTLVSLAVESGSDYIRNQIMGKRVSREKIINAFRLCGEAGMMPRAFFIIGMPEDTEETLRETLELIQDIDSQRISVNLALPVPGTGLYEQCVRDHLLTGGQEEAALWTGEVEPMAYLMAGHTNTVEFYIKPYDLSLEKLTQIALEIRALAEEKTRAWTEHVQG